MRVVKFKNRLILKIIFNLIDKILWIFIKLIPNKLLFYLIKKRHIKKVKLNFKNEKKIFLKEKLFLYLIDLDSKKIAMSSCLSRSILGSILLNLLNVPNKINLGITKLSCKRKSAHAWLTEIDGDMTTLNKNLNCVKLTDL